MIQVSIPATVPLKEFDYNAEVEIINPVADTVANATFQGADVDWYIKADDIVLKNKHSVSNGNNKSVDSNQKDKQINYAIFDIIFIKKERYHYGR